MPGSLEDVSLLSDVGTMVFSDIANHIQRPWKTQQFVPQFGSILVQIMLLPSLTIGLCATELEVTWHLLWWWR